MKSGSLFKLDSFLSDLNSWSSRCFSLNPAGMESVWSGYINPVNLLDLDSKPNQKKLELFIIVNNNLQLINCFFSRLFPHLNVFTAAHHRLFKSFSCFVARFSISSKFSINVETFYKFEHFFCFIRSVMMLKDCWSLKFWRFFLKLYLECKKINNNRDRNII